MTPTSPRSGRWSPIRREPGSCSRSATAAALPASVLADEAGVAASTASAHLGKLVDGRLLTVERHGRHRYFALAGQDVAELIEALARSRRRRRCARCARGPGRTRCATRAPVTTTSPACSGTQLMASMLDRGLLTGGDGAFDRSTAGEDRLSAPGSDYDYRLTARGEDELEQFGIDFAELRSRPRPMIRYCVDWSEQRHHLAGSLGAALADRMFDLRWVSRARRGRAVTVSDEGARGLEETFGLTLS